jgi:hypothetical protein
MTDAPRRVYIGSFEGGTDIVFIPQPVLERAGAQLDAEHKKREREVAMAKLRVMQNASARGKLRKLMRMVFRGHRRAPQ